MTAPESLLPPVQALTAYWNLRERPFEALTDPRFYYASSEHEEALARLRYVVAEESIYFGLLTGEIGSGKSSTRKVFAQSLPSDKVCVLQLENSVFGFTEHSQNILQQFGWGEAAREQSTLAGVYGLYRSLLEHLASHYGLQLVLLFDEAQDMSRETLEQFKRLSNLNDEIAGRLTMIFIGQPELRQQLAGLPAFEQRIGLRYHLGPLSVEDTGAYLRHRLQVAGHAHGRLFTPAASQLIHEASRGIPREINRLAKLSLESARTGQSTLIEPSHVHEVLLDLQRQAGRY